jgi:hypothetical protein
MRHLHFQYYDNGIAHAAHSFEHTFAGVAF